YDSVTGKLLLLDRTNSPCTSGGIDLLRGPCVTCTKFDKTIDIPIAEISGANRNEPRNGRQATRSITQSTSDANSTATRSTITRESANEAMRSQEVSTSNAISAMNAETMNTS